MVSGRSPGLEELMKKTNPVTNVLVGDSDVSMEVGCAFGDLLGQSQERKNGVVPAFVFSQGWHRMGSYSHRLQPGLHLALLMGIYELEA